MLLAELIGKPNHQLTDEELEFKLKELQKLKYKAPKPVATKKSGGAAPKRKSNSDKQMENAVKNLNDEQKKKLKEMLGL